MRLPSHNESVTTEEWRCGLPQTTDSRQEGFMTLRYLEIFLALARTPNMRDAAAKPVHITSGGLQRAPGFRS